MDHTSVPWKLSKKSGLQLQKIDMQLALELLV